MESQDQMTDSGVQAGFERAGAIVKDVAGGPGTRWRATARAASARSPTTSSLALAEVHRYEGTMHRFGADALGQRSRADEVAEEDRYLLALSFPGRCWR